MIAAVIDKVTKEVINIIMADAEKDAPPSDDVFLVNVNDSGVGIGWLYDETTSEFQRNPEEIKQEESILQEWIDKQWVEN